MKPIRGTAHVEAKRDARLWILAAIQARNEQPSKAVEKEVRRFVRRLQRDITALDRALVQLENSRWAQVAKLMQEQAKDAGDRRMRFENAIR
jgi:hypothetical protein